MKQAKIEAPEVHKKLIRKRIETAKATNYLDWEKAKTRIKLDDGFSHQVDKMLFVYFEKHWIKKQRR